MLLGWYCTIPLVLEPVLQCLGETLLVQMGLGFCNQPRAGQISNIAEPAMIDLVKDHVRDEGVLPAWQLCLKHRCPESSQRCPRAHRFDDRFVS